MRCFLDIAVDEPNPEVRDASLNHEATSALIRGKCQPGGRWGALEVHHVVKRAQGGSDFDLDRLVTLCPPCHAQTDAPYARGRLVVTPRGAGRFTVQVTCGADKWPSRA